MFRRLIITAVGLSLMLGGCRSLQTPPSEQSSKPAMVRATLRCGTIDMSDDTLVAERINFSPEKLVDLKRRRSVSNEDICTMPEKRYQRMLARLASPKPDHPGEWATFRALQRQNEDGLVRPDGLINGLRQRHELLAHTADKGTRSPSDAGINVTSWAELGPGNIGGRIRAIAIHPVNTATIFIGSVSGGIWKSTNAGASWSPVNDFMGNLSVSSIVIDPNNPSIMYAGTGEGFYNFDAVRGYGVFKSIDNGLTWNQLPSTIPSNDQNSAAYSWFYVNRLAIATDGTLLAATGHKNSGRIWRSTDGGASWTATYPNRILDLRFDPNNSSRALAVSKGFNPVSQLWESSIVRSTDGGANWLPSHIFTSDKYFDNRIELAYTRADSQIVYASRDNSGGEVWRSPDGGITWALASTPGHLGEQGWYDNTLWVDPTDPAHLLIGGIDLYRSVDNGTTWTKVSTWYFEPSSPHADHHIIISDPGYNGGSNSRVYVGNDGGIYKADDIKTVTDKSSANGWTNLNNGLAITQFYGAAGSVATGRVYGGTQDNGSLLQPASGSSWTHVFGGDGGYSAVDASGSYLFGEYVYLQLHRSTNGGASEASYIHNGITDANSGDTANFIAPFILDPNNDNTLLAGGKSLWRSTNAKGSTPGWSAIKPPVAKNISAIAVRQGDPNLIWVGHNDGNLFKSDNGTASVPTWSPVGKGTGSAFTPARMVNRILVDRDNPDIVYVAYGGYANDNLYRTTNGGASWENIHGSLPSVPVFTIVRHPTKPAWLYAGTEVGLFTSIDAGTTWKTGTDGPANVEISELFWLDSSTLVAATHGRGVFRATVSSGDQAPIDVSVSTKPLGRDLAYKGAKKKLSFTAPTATVEEIRQNISAPPWVTIDPTSIKLAKGKGSLVFSVAANPTIERQSGTIVLGSAQYAVAQAATPCKIVSLTTQTNGLLKTAVPKTGGVSTVVVDVYPEACSWKISSAIVTPCGKGQEQACLGAWFADAGTYPDIDQLLSGDRTLSGTVAATLTARTLKGIVEIMPTMGKSVKKFSIKQLAK